jgi:hypothetical protein
MTDIDFTVIKMLSKLLEKQPVSRTQLPIILKYEGQQIPGYIRSKARVSKFLTDTCTYKEILTNIAIQTNIKASSLVGDASYILSVVSVFNNKSQTYLQDKFYDVLEEIERHVETK